jgi:transposase
MEAAAAIVGRRVRQFRTTEEKRLIVEETRRAGVSVATVARAHGVNANQVFYWRKLYEAGLLESTAVLGSRDMELPRVRLLPVTVDEGADRQAVVAVAGSTLDRTAGSFSSPGMIELTLLRGQVRIAGQVDAGTLGTVLQCLLA